MRDAFLDFLQKLFGDERQITLEKTPPPIISKTTIIPLQYRDDVKKLKTYVGEENWKAGLEISLYLSELLTICPRERKRSDSFRKLIAYLDDELNIKLTIKSRRKENE